MNIRKKGGRFTPIPLLLAVLLPAGCAAPLAYQKPVTNFQKASVVVMDNARTEYKNANKSERDIEIDSRVDKRQKINAKILESDDLVLYSNSALETRMAALDAISKHGQLLLALAGSDAPTKARSAAVSLESSLAGLGKSLNMNISNEFNNKAEGFAAIEGEVIKLVLNGRITEALDKAVISSDSQIKPLITLLKEEYENNSERRRTRLSKTRVMAFDAYNDILAKKPVSPEKLKVAAEEIKKAQDSWESFALLNRAEIEGFSAMLKAHGELVDYAKSSKGPGDFSALVEATEAFATEAEAVAQALGKFNK
ncbi:MAG: hypothetical protein HGA70_04855 [Chlorobiaceae bacterium]|nr:hypothetical protein [Chlorobiaceae bacterium]